MHLNNQVNLVNIFVKLTSDTLKYNDWWNFLVSSSCDISSKTPFTNFDVSAEFTTSKNLDGKF
jgi:hypothetical protein